MAETARLLDDTMNTGGEAIPFGGDLLVSVDDAGDLGALACIYAINSKNDDSGLGSGSNDDWGFLENEGSASGDMSEAIANLN